METSKLRLGDYHFSPLRRFAIKWETRSLGADIDRLIAILPCVIYADKAKVDILLLRTHDALKKYLKQNAYALPRILDRIVMRVLRYKNDEKHYLQDRGKIFEILLQNIQLYSVVVDILDDPMFAHLLEVFSERLKEGYDREYTLNTEGQRMLSFQEKYSV
ncbi:hypothetical protein [uncultured Helicobacter sp.]|uniref:hypothetical protein n=1 Tax=uncultured Helicobacter sp. TaxID=175537 RepID=UPI0037525AF0